MGEIGLDHLRARGIAQRQHARWVFLQQLELARRFRLPVVIHSVRCHALMVQLLRQAGLPQTGLIHSFQGPADWIQPYREMGFLLSLGPHSLRRLSQIPRVGILLETDAPARQTQLYQLTEVAREVADRLHLSLQELVSGCDQALRLLLHQGTERGNMGPGHEIMENEDPR